MISFNEDDVAQVFKRGLQAVGLYPKDPEPVTVPHPDSRHIDIHASADPVVTYYITDNTGHRHGYCIISARMTEQGPEAALYHIYVNPDVRQKGYGRDLLAAVKVHYSSIYTDALSRSGKKLLLSCGFTRDSEGTFRWNKEAAK